ncbi:MAG: aspartate 1-decarboxylase, partial [Candidatus Paceibacterota bacterium]
EGSIGVDASLMEKAGFLAGEKVLVADNSNGSRFETYMIKEEAGSGRIMIYGAASYLAKKGDEIIIMGFELADEEIKPKVVLLGKGNSMI